MLHKARAGHVVFYEKFPVKMKLCQKKHPGPCEGLQCLLHTQPELPCTSASLGFIFWGGICQVGVSEDDQDLGQPFEEAT